MPSGPEPWGDGLGPPSSSLGGRVPGFTGPLLGDRPNKPRPLDNIPQPSQKNKAKPTTLSTSIPRISNSRRPVTHPPPSALTYFSEDEEAEAIPDGPLSPLRFVWYLSSELSVRSLTEVTAGSGIAESSFLCPSFTNLGYRPWGGGRV